MEERARIRVSRKISNTTGAQKLQRNPFEIFNKEAKYILQIGGYIV